MRKIILLGVVVLLSRVLAACVDPGVTNCGTYVCPAKLMCDPSGAGCINPDRVMQCKDAADFTPCSYENVPNGACYHGICSPAGCGNGVQDPGETCDDGNRNNGDGCSASCDSNETCGNAVTDLAVGETCDDGDYQSHDGCSSVCGIEKLMWQYAGGGEPPPLYGNRYPAVFDRARGRMVVAGGNVGDFKFETWEWSGVGWVRAFADPTYPALRYRSALAYDARRRRVVMFGGRDGVSSSRDDTWEWDGRQWQQVLTPTSPPARHSHALTYDAARGKIVLFGGTNLDFVYHGNDFADTWEYDGVTWTQVTPATSPPVMRNHVMTYDPNLGVTVVFGSGGLWEYDGSTWRDQSAAVPTGLRDRNDAAAVYDPMRKRVVVFGGHDGNGVIMTSTLEWDGSTLTEIPGTPSMPLVSGDYDTAKQRVVGVVAQPSGQFEVWVRAGTTWSLASPPAASPPGREQHAMAYDPVRDRVVLFGGTASADAEGAGAIPIEYGDTWEWDGARWRDVTPATGSPPARHAHQMAYDAISGHVLLFGGLNNVSNMLADTWEWDGTAWTELTVTTPPPARASAGIATAANGSVVLFGGDSGSGVLNDTWIWNGTSWAKRNVTSPPPARSEGHLALDNTGTIVLFGGSGGGQAFSDTWRWDGLKWTNITPAGDRPASRQGFAMTSDGSSVWVATGASATGSGLFDDLWEWVNGAWVTHPDAGRLIAPRTGSAMVGVSGGRVLLFGGTSPSLINVNYYDDTWLLTNGQWAEVTSRADVPAARSEASAAYIASRGEVLLFGGNYSGDNQYPLADTWRWIGGGWQRVESVASPPARAGAAIAYDAARDRVVLFGGVNTASLLNDVWEWDGTQWLDVTPSSGPAPAPRRGALMAYDAAHHVIVLFGGDDFTSFGDTWTWNGSAWTQLSPAASPPSRTDAGMVYDDVRQRIVLFGGFPGGGGGAPLLGDTWEWDGTTWIDVTPATGSPEPRNRHALVYDRASRQVLLIGGVTDGLVGQLPVYAWDGQRWSTVELAGAPAGLRFYTATAYDDARSRVVMFGGITADLIAQTNTALNETWTAAYDSALPDETCLYGVDGDHDNLLGCDDPDCAGYCYPLCPPGTSCMTGPRCGDGVCDPRLETCRSCAQDCGACAAVCGDSLCDPGETAAACPGDCTAL